MKCKLNVNSQWPAYLLYYNEVKKQDGAFIASGEKIR